MGAATSQQGQHFAADRLLAGRNGIRQDKLIDALWPNVPPPKASQRLRTLLWQIRQALAPYDHTLTRSHDVIRVEPTLVTVDLLHVLTRARQLQERQPLGGQGTGDLDL